MHLSDLSYRRFLEGTLPPSQRRALVAHLGAECDPCEQYLVGLDEADALDGAVDAALCALAPAGLGAGNDLEFDRIESRLAGRGVLAPPVPIRAARARRRLVPALAIAATLVAAGLAGLLVARQGSGHRHDDGIKGASSADAVPLRLRFLVLTPAEGGAPTIEKGVSGQEVPATASLQFQVDLGRSAEVLLARVPSGGGQDVFFRARLPAGRSAVTVSGQPAAYPLSSLAGPQRFLALASEAPIDPAEVVRAAAHAAGARPEDGPAISLDVVEVQVRP